VLDVSVHERQLRKFRLDTVPLATSAAAGPPQLKIIVR
jgi:hypothetical protein